MSKGVYGMDQITTNAFTDNGIEIAHTTNQLKHLKELQRLTLEVLLVFDKFCHENELIYYLGEGTLLGAIRHKGFIPWDDDIDIYMMREDFNRFLALAKDGLPSGYCLDSQETNPRFWTTMPRVEMTRKTLYHMKRYKGVALFDGPHIDVFPIDYVPDDQTVELIKRRKKLGILRRMLWIKSGLHSKEEYKGYKAKFILYYPLKLLGALQSFEKIHKKLDHVMTKTNDASHQYLSCFASLYGIEKETFPKEWFGKPNYAEFEGHMFPIPSFSHAILTRIYRDYMAFPAVEQRKLKHSYNITDF